jgi:hypothetical protein
MSKCGDLRKTNLWLWFSATTIAINGDIVQFLEKSCLLKVELRGLIAPPDLVLRTTSILLQTVIWIFR